MSNLQLAVHFFFQIAVILAACQIVGLAGRRAGQPQVLAEMVAGILLGPSLLGLFFPGLFARIFPPDTMRVLFPVAQLGLAAYMFVVGLEFRLDIVRSRMRSAVAVSIVGMVAPFVLGAVLGWGFFHHTALFPARTSLWEGMLFLGAALCITAFPVLARIIQFKKLTGTPMGTVSLGAGAINDAAAWCLLAIVLAKIDGDVGQAALTIGGKGVACWLAARATGVSNREALGIGTLMNVRGLMELIIINIGLQRGIISPALFAMLVIMAAVTTLMASPTFDWLVGRNKPAEQGEG